MGWRPFSSGNAPVESIAVAMGTLDTARLKYQLTPRGLSLRPAVWQSGEGLIDFKRDISLIRLTIKDQEHEHLIVRGHVLHKLTAAAQAHYF